MKDSSTATERVGRYQLLELIGGGPNGTVARAKVFGVAGFERQFAVKRFAAELTTGAYAQALSAAARSYGSLEHPRIARMSEFGVAQGQTFTAVEYVGGLDVFRLLQEAKLANVTIAAGGALALVSQAARAVGYAHGRGLSHLGLSPTNVIVTGDGDVKVTDFGILASTMPARPAESPRLASRVPYLSPEQISGEATSAATDVFVLGVIAYELVTGQRAYRGDSPAQIAQAIVAGPPSEPALPRPIVRVLQRCLARSPFERFPDARALADALDAALRVAPVPGTRKDVGAQVKTTLERYAALNEGNVSGMVALNLSASAPPPESAGRRPEARTEPSPLPTFGTPTQLPRMGGLASSPGSTIKDMAKPAATITGLAPPPIPVPPGVAPPPATPGMVPGNASTILGMPAAKKPLIPSIPNVPAKVGSLTQGWDAMPDPAESAPDGSASGPSSGPMTIPDPIASESDEPLFKLVDDDAMSGRDPVTVHGLAAPPTRGMKRPTPGHNFDSTTGEMSSAQLKALTARAQLGTSELSPLQRDMNGAEDAITKPVAIATPADAGSPGDSLNDFATDSPAVGHEHDAYEASSTMPSLSPPPPARPVSQPSISVPSPSTSRPEIVAEPDAPASRPSMPPARSRMPMIAGIVLGIGILGAGGYYAYNEFVAKKAGTPVAMGSASAIGSDGSAGSATTGSAGSATGSAGSVGSAGSAIPVMTGSDGSAGSAGSAAGRDGSAGSAISASAMTGSDGSAAGGSAAGSNGSVGLNAGAGSNTSSGSGSAVNDSGNIKVQPSQKSDQLEVASTPVGARVFLDGAELGKSPLKQPGSADRHTLAVLLPGHDLYIAEVDGAGVYNVTLNPVKSAKSGPGIKIETCKAKNRYYIYLDGQPSGQTCPTEKRIVTTLGTHTVEVYDIVTETRKKYDVDIKDDRLSVRVKIDE